MSRKQELTLHFSLSKLRNNPIRNKSIIKIIFRLIHEKRIRITQQKQMKNGGALLTSRQLIQ